MFINGAMNKQTILYSHHIISISIADSEKADKITQELLQSLKIKQLNYQKTVVENSKNVDVTITVTSNLISFTCKVRYFVKIKREGRWVPSYT